MNLSAASAAATAVEAANLGLFGVVLGSSLRPLGEALADVRRPTWAALAGLMAFNLLVLKPLVPHAVWHEQHAVEIMTPVETGRLEAGMRMLHGPTYNLLMRGLYRLAGGSLSVFTLNYLIACASVGLLFVLTLRLTASAGAAFASACLLTLLPAHLRLSATESMFIPLEAFLLLAALSLTLFNQTARRRFLLLGLSAVLSAMNLRAEMILAAPLLGAAFLLLPAPGKGRLPAESLLLAAAGLGAAMLPRVIELLALSDPRLRQSLEPGRVFGRLRELGAAEANIFFDPAFTPWIYWILAGAGALWLLRRDWRGSLPFHLAWAGMTALYAWHLSCLALRVRTAMASQVFLVLLAGAGAGLLWDRLRAPWKAVVPAVVCAALVLDLPLYAGVVRRLYTKQQEYLFVADLPSLLPAGATVVLLSQSDHPGTLQTRAEPEQLLALRMHRRGGIRSTGITAFLPSFKDRTGESRFFYRGSACYSRPMRMADGGLIIEGEPGPDYEDPLCRLMAQAFRLVPLSLGTLAGDSHSWDAIEGKDRTIGLYRIEPRALRRGGAR